MDVSGVTELNHHNFGKVLSTPSHGGHFIHESVHFHDLKFSGDLLIRVMFSLLDDSGPWLDFIDMDFGREFESLHFIYAVRYHLEVSW